MFKIRDADELLLATCSYNIVPILEPIFLNYYHNIIELANWIGLHKEKQ